MSRLLFSFALLLSLAAIPPARATDTIDWQTLCAGDAASPVDARHARYVFLDDSAPDPVTRTLVVPKSLVRSAYAWNKATPGFTHVLQLALRVPAATASQAMVSDGDPAARFAGIRPAPGADEQAPGDAVLLRFDVVRDYGLRDRRRQGAVIGIDAASGLARLDYPGESGSYFGGKGPEHFARLDGAQRVALYQCGRRAAAECRTDFDRIDGVRLEMVFARARLPQAQTLEATARALLRCFVKGG